jgi:hypothetical protein
MEGVEGGRSLEVHGGVGERAGLTSGAGHPGSGGIEVECAEIGGGGSHWRPENGEKRRGGGEP